MMLSVNGEEGEKGRKRERQCGSNIYKPPVMDEKPAVSMKMI